MFTPARRSRVRGARRLRRPAIAAAAALLAAVVLASAAPARASASATDPAVVAADLGANKIPAALVVLVDISDSMSASNGGLYPRVLTALPRFFAALARQDPQDRAAVVVFGNRNDTRTVYPMGPVPVGKLPLPSDATSLGTDIGYAFQQALQNLAQAKNVQVGGVLLLSDGGLWEPNDQAYDGGAGYHAPGWARLRTQLAGIGLPVTGYGLPLTSNGTDIDALGRALTAGFGAQQQMLSSDFGDLTGQLDLAQQKILDSRVAVAAAPDSGRGVRVSWQVPAAGNGGLNLDLSVGHADVPVKLTATTSRVPLQVIDPTVKVTGFPVSVTARMPSAVLALRPGQSVTVPVMLSWSPVSQQSSLAAGGQSWPGRLTLSAQVSSPFRNAIQNYYLDRSFAVGALSGGTSVAFLAAVPQPLNLLPWLLIALLVLAAIGAGGLFRARLDGRLILAPARSVGTPVPLPARPWCSWRIDRVIGVPGKMTVRGSPLSRTMHIRLQRANLPPVTKKLPPGGRAMIAGIEVRHETYVPEPPGPDPGSPDQW